MRPRPRLAASLAGGQRRERAGGALAGPHPDRAQLRPRGRHSTSGSMDADGRNPRRLTTDPGIEGEPAWTPDGTRLIYTATPKAGPPQLASIRLDGTDDRTLTASAARQLLGGCLARRKTGSRSSPPRDGDPKIYESGAGGSGQRRVTKTLEARRARAICPNGDLVYVAEKGERKARFSASPAGAATPGAVIETTSRSWRSTSRATARAWPMSPASWPSPARGTGSRSRLQPLVAANSTPMLGAAPTGRADRRARRSEPGAR